MKQAIKLDNDVRDVLSRAVIEGNLLRLTGQLDRKLYERTNKALEALGGTWNRGKRAHVFEGDPRAAIAAAAEEGKVAHPNQDDFFPTPIEVALLACQRLNVGDRWLRTLEPSAGEGDLIAPLVGWLGMPSWDQLRLIEKDQRRAAVLRAKGFEANVMEQDFLTTHAVGIPSDRILMNPPFHNGADAVHIGHALDFLAPGGRLVAIASAGFKGRATKATKAVRDRLMAWGALIEDLPEGSFKQAGTSVATVLVTVDRPRSS